MVSFRTATHWWDTVCNIERIVYLVAMPDVQNGKGGGSSTVGNKVAKNATSVALVAHIETAVVGGLSPPQRCSVWPNAAKPLDRHLQFVFFFHSKTPKGVQIKYTSDKSTCFLLTTRYPFIQRHDTWKTERKKAGSSGKSFGRHVRFDIFFNRKWLCK